MNEWSGWPRSAAREASAGPEKTVRPMAVSLCGYMYSRTVSQLITPSTPKTYQASNSAVSRIEAFGTTPSRVTSRSLVHTRMGFGLQEGVLFQHQVDRLGDLVIYPGDYRMRTSQAGNARDGHRAGLWTLLPWLFDKAYLGADREAIEARM